MRLLLLTLAALAAIGAAAWVAGSVLPVAHEATRTATFQVSPEVLFQVLADRDRHREWWHDDTPTTVVESQPPERLVTRIIDGLPFGGTWTFEVAREGSGSRLTITERGEVYNPMFRLMSRYVFGHTATMDRFLAALRTRLSQG